MSAETRAPHHEFTIFRNLDLPVCGAEFYTQREQRSPDVSGSRARLPRAGVACAGQQNELLFADHRFQARTMSQEAVSKRSRL